MEEESVHPLLAKRNKRDALQLSPGTIIGGHYIVFDCLGTDGSSAVFKCRHKDLEGPFLAMKVLHPNLNKNQEAAARFHQEVVSSYNVTHQNVVRTHEFINDGTTIAYTMEYMEYGTLKDRLDQEDPLEIKDIIIVASQICEGLQAIHQAGIIHRNIKPGNIFFSADGYVKIADFGIAKTGSGPKLTSVGVVLGTVGYASPEYLETGEVDHRSDIYALGMLMYEMLTGEYPFNDPNPVESLKLRLTTDPVSPSELRPDCPPALAEIVLKALSRKPINRYQSTRELFEALEPLSEGEISQDGLPQGLAEQQGDAAALDALHRNSDLASPQVEQPEQPASASQPSKPGFSGSFQGAFDKEFDDDFDGDFDKDFDDEFDEPVGSYLKRQMRNQIVIGGGIVLLLVGLLVSLLYFSGQHSSKEGEQQSNAAPIEQKAKSAIQQQQRKSQTKQPTATKKQAPQAVALEQPAVPKQAGPQTTEAPERTTETPTRPNQEVAPPEPAKAAQQQQSAAVAPSSTETQAIPVEPKLPLVVPAPSEDTAGTAASDAVQKPAQDTASKPQVHIMRAGETVGGIAQKYGISVTKLMEINSISDPTKLQVGTKLQLSE